MLNEAAIVAELKTAFPDYIGDDAAVIEPPTDEPYVISKDLLVEDTHFRPSYITANALAHKALQVNLSDIAAMGATPTFVLLGLAIPMHQEVYSRAFYQAFVQACQQAGVVLIGGDTTRSNDKFFISVTVIGRAPSNQLKYRHRAKVGDWIIVCGQLGHAHVGLIACERQLTGFTPYKEALFMPMAKVPEGAWFGQQAGVSAMMDLSDGLYIDLRRLCDASKVQGVLELTHFPLAAPFNEACNQLGLMAEEVLLIGGEDYGLLLTVNPEAYESLEKAFFQQFGYSLKQLGRIKEGQGIVIQKQGYIKNFDLKPFSHFDE